MSNLPFVEEILADLRRFKECVEDNQDVDLDRDRFDLLTKLSLLERVQRSPARWMMTQAGEDAIAQPAAGEPLSEVAKQNAILEQIKSGLEGVLYPPAAAPLAAGKPVDGVEGFACWLIDHCEGYEIFEEKIQDWVADYLKSDAYQHVAVPPAAAPGNDAPGTVRVTADWLKKVHRDLDACQKVIWLAGCRPRVPGGFDPAYCEDAQERLKEIDEQIAHAQAAGGQQHA